MVDHPWTSVLGGAILFQERVLAEISGGDRWRFDVQRPYETNEKALAEVVREILPHVRGMFELSSGAPEVLLELIRQRTQLTLRGIDSTGVVGAEVTVDGQVTSIRDAVVTLFPFTVTGDVWFNERQ